MWPLQDDLHGARHPVQAAHTETALFSLLRLYVHPAWGSGRWGPSIMLCVHSPRLWCGEIPAARPAPRAMAINNSKVQFITIPHLSFLFAKEVKLEQRGEKRPQVWEPSASHRNSCLIFWDPQGQRSITVITFIAYRQMGITYGSSAHFKQWRKEVLLMRGGAPPLHPQAPHSLSESREGSRTWETRQYHTTSQRRVHGSRSLQFTRRAAPGQGWEGKVNPLHLLLDGEGPGPVQ